MPVQTRRLPIGAERTDDGVSFRVWAPARERVEVLVVGGPAFALEPERDGYHAGELAGLRAGARYWLRLDGDRTIPDPASRFQPEGPEGPSEVIDPSSFEWTDAAWAGPTLAGQVVYELHVGTFTPRGTFVAAAGKLPHLADLGITTIEVMPVADFAGDFGWGYDGVDLFAPTRLYGRPDDFRGFVDAAHRHGIAVILDAVYNHLGPRGNFLRELSPHYFTDRYENEWGDALDYDGPESGPVRELVLASVEHWIVEYHLDGLRLDAVQAILDSSPLHLVAAITRRAREAAGRRNVLLVGESEPQSAALLRASEQGGYALDALWNDDFHHAARVAAGGRAEAYLSPYRGSAQELLSAARWGFLYQGQRYSWQGKRRGSPALDIDPARFVCYLDNHDQVANSARSLRLHQRTSPGRFRALTGLLLLVPQTPMLFQGQEMAASAPFFYFADHPGELGRQVREGRRDFLAQFASLRSDEAARVLRDPGDPATFAACKLDWSEREVHGEALALHRDLLRLRREDPTLAPRAGRRPEGAVLGDAAFVLRFLGEGGDDRLVLVNLGVELRLPAAPEPLLAPPAGRRWRTLWTSEAFVYGGGGTPPRLDDDETGWTIPGETTVVLAPAPRGGEGEETQP